MEKKENSPISQLENDDDDEEEFVNFEVANF